MGYSLDLGAVMDEITDIMVIYLKMEQIFSAFQSAKILHYYGFESSSEFFHPSKTQKRIKQETSVLSYYIIKGGFMNALPKFLDFIMEMNKSTIENPVLNMKFNKDNKEQFKNLIKDCVIRNTNYHELIDLFIREIRSKGLVPKEQMPMTHFNIDKTLRMSIIELGDAEYEY